MFDHINAALVSTRNSLSKHLKILSTPNIRTIVYVQLSPNKWQNLNWHEL